MKNKLILFCIFLTIFEYNYSQQATQQPSWWQQVKNLFFTQSPFERAENKLKQEQAYIDNKIAKFLSSQTHDETINLQSKVSYLLEKRIPFDTGYLRYLYQGPNKVIFSKDVLTGYGELPYLGYIERAITSPDNNKTFLWSYILYGTNNQLLGIISAEVTPNYQDFPIIIETPSINLFDYDQLFYSARFKEEYKDFIKYQSQQLQQQPEIVKELTEEIPQEEIVEEELESAEQEELRSSLTRSPSSEEEARCKKRIVQQLADYKRNPLFKKIVERTQHYQKTKGTSFKFYVYMDSQKKVQLLSHLKGMKLQNTDYTLKGILQGQILAPRPLDELIVQYTIYHPAFKILGSTVSMDKLNAVPLETGTYTIPLEPEGIRFNTQTFALLFPPIQRSNVVQRENTIGIKKPITSIDNKFDTFITPALIEYFQNNAPKFENLSKNQWQMVNEILKILSKKMPNTILMNEKKYFDFNQGLASIKLLDKKDLLADQPYMMVAINGKKDLKNKQRNLLIRLQIVSHDSKGNELRGYTIGAIAGDVIEKQDSISFKTVKIFTENSLGKNFVDLVMPTIQNYIVDEIKKNAPTIEEEFVIM